MCPFFAVLVSAGLEVGLGLEEGISSVLARVPQQGFRQCLHGCLRAVSCEVREFPYCFWGVCGPW